MKRLFSFHQKNDDSKRAKFEEGSSYIFYNVNLVERVNGAWINFCDSTFIITANIPYEIVYKGPQLQLCDLKGLDFANVDVD